MFEWVFVDTEAGLAAAIKHLSCFKELVFDSEGVNLSRTGPLTVAVFRGVFPEDSPAYVIDIQTLGGKAAFMTGLGSLLESCQVLKITFDCRADSDALAHQFGVRLTNVLDMQVYEQAVRVASGEPLPCKRFFRGVKCYPYVKGMASMTRQYIPSTTMNQLGGTTDNGPHKTDHLVWQKRPITEAVISYAANDVHITCELLKIFRQRKVPDELMVGVITHSERYTRHLRDRPIAANFSTDKDYIMEEIPIV